MQISHVGVIVSDMEKSLKLYRDMLGLTIYSDELVPEGDTLNRETMYDKVYEKNATSRVAILTSGDGTMLQLKQSIMTKIKKEEKEQVRYGFSGFSELAFSVSNIDEWFGKIKEAGYKTQTDDVQEADEFVRSFLFYDPDGQGIKMVEDILPDEVLHWDRQVRLSKNFY